MEMFIWHTPPKTAGREGKNAPHSADYNSTQVAFSRWQILSSSPAPPQQKAAWSRELWSSAAHKAGQYGMCQGTQNTSLQDLLVA